MAKVEIPEGITGKDLFTFLVTNKTALLAEKKYDLKRSDAFRLSNLFVTETGEVIKAAPSVVDETDTLVRRCVINTTNWLDSHKDVHIPGIWKKSLSENKALYLLQEHSMTFKGIITDEVRAYTKRMSWKSLGLDMAGDTEALIFEATIPKSRNEFMFNEYKNDRVKNHSVGMRYVQIELAINHEDYKEEFAVWNKYIDQVANKEEAEQGGFFWAVKEAKAVEGSAVPIGSNIITPTLGASKESTEEEPVITTQKQPQKSRFATMGSKIKN